MYLPGRHGDGASGAFRRERDNKREDPCCICRTKIPHGVAVEDRAVQEKSAGSDEDQRRDLLREESRRKGMIIGKGGRKLKGIGKRAPGRRSRRCWEQKKVFLGAVGKGQGKLA